MKPNCQTGPQTPASSGKQLCPGKTAFQCPSCSLSFCTGSSLPPSHTHSLWLGVFGEAPLLFFSQVIVTGTIARLTLSYYISFNRTETQGFGFWDKNKRSKYIKFIGKNIVRQFCVGEKCQISSHKV